MDADRFDQLTRLVMGATSRRGTFRSGVVGLAGLLALLCPWIGSAAPRRPRKKRNRGNKNKKGRRRGPKPNAFGCLNVGQKCRGKDSKCCSGICEGKKPKPGKRDRSKCVGHDAATCPVGQQSNFCNPAAVDVSCTTTGNFAGTCLTTTGNAAYCGSAAGCFACSRDTDCEGPCGPGAACVPCAVCAAFGGTACYGLGSCAF